MTQPQATDRMTRSVLSLAALIGAMVVLSGAALGQDQKQPAKQPAPAASANAAADADASKHKSRTIENKRLSARP